MTHLVDQDDLQPAGRTSRLGIASRVPNPTLVRAEHGEARWAGCSGPLFLLTQMAIFRP